MSHPTLSKAFFPWNGFYAPPAIGYTVPNYQPPYDQPRSNQSPYGPAENEPRSSSSLSADLTSPRPDPPDKFVGASHSPVASQMPADGVETAASIAIN
jgi:hypothetical protein